MKSTYLAYALVLPILGLGIVGANIASAHGFSGGMGFMRNAAPEEIAAHHEEMFARQASLLGVSADTVKQGWAEGKSIFEIAEESGISVEALQAKMKEVRLIEMKSRLQTLVERGVISQAQADTRLAAMESFETKFQGKRGGGMRAMHSGFGL